MQVKTLGAYADKISVEPGDTIAIRVNCDEGGPDQFGATIVRLLSGDNQPAGPGYRDETVDLAANGRYPARHQRIFPGSHGIAPHHAAFETLESFTVQILFWPTTPERPWKSIVSKFDESTEHGWGLFTNGDGHACFFIGDGNDHTTARVAAPEPLIARQWYLLAGSYDADTKELRIVQRMIQPHATLPERCEATADGSTVASPHNHTAAFMAGAYNHRDNITPWFPGGHVNGKLERPVVSHGLLGDDEVMALTTGPMPEGLKDRVVIAWDFSIDISTDRLADISGNGIDGEAVNLPMRAKTGHNWDTTQHRWTDAPEQWGALYVVEDAIYDCGWETDIEATLPADVRSGLYAAKLEREGSVAEFVPFVVRPRKGETTAPLCVVMPDASYLAYANIDETFDPGYDFQFNRVARMGPDDLYQNDHPEIGMSMYGLHADGSGPHYSSRLRPVVNFSPTHNSLWQLSADMHLIAWLEHEDIAYDMITDEDIDREGVDLLKQWPCVMTMSHPEYTSTRMLDAYEAFTGQGGRLMYMGGNGFYWRVAYNPDKPGVIEMRRAEDGSRSWIAEPGEYYMSFTGEMGGLWWHAGRAPNKLVGNGFIAQGFDWSSPYRITKQGRDPRAAWMFEGIDGDLVGDTGLLGGGAAGWELDCANPERGTPPHALVVASSFDHSDTVLLVNEEIGHMHPRIHGSINPQIRADMMFFETAQGGAVFATGSITYVSALPCNNFQNTIAVLTSNVIRRFCDPAPF
ncbi:MAG: N,N-dimethylformamidase [Rhodospirillaceae bacterium]|nr:N,N-dimethylformamidase [Rhodospirillaceae bacterium]|tara:strand:- start:2803 stop:5043 length:2241 start_codon:yes stop_codon:yes gene_type:complete